MNRQTAPDDIYGILITPGTRAPNMFPALGPFQTLEEARKAMPEARYIAGEAERRLPLTGRDLYDLSFACYTVVRMRAGTYRWSHVELQARLKALDS